MIRQVLEAGLDAPIVFARHEHEAVSAPDLLGQVRQCRRRRARRILLEHAVEHGQAEHLGVDQFRLGPLRPEGADQPLGEANALPSDR